MSQGTSRDNEVDSISSFPWAVPRKVAFFSTIEAGSPSFGRSVRASRPLACPPPLKGRFLALLISMGTAESFIDRGAFEELY